MSKMSSVVSLFCLAVAGCSTINGQLEHSAPPPGAYVATIPVSVRYVPREALAGLCDLSPDRLVGCAKLWPGERCDVYISRHLSPALRRETEAHERAHCGGWAHVD